MTHLYSDERKILTAQRLKALRKEKGFSLVELSKELFNYCGLSVSKDSLMKYEITEVYHSSFGAAKGMATDTLYCLARYYNVSTDYLLGITDTRNPLPEMKTTCDFTRLSEDAISTIITMDEKNHPDPYYYRHLDFKSPLRKILNTLIKENFITNTTKAFGYFLHELITQNEIDSWESVVSEEKEHIKRKELRQLNAEIFNEVENVISTLMLDLNAHYMGLADEEDLP
jgi:transcriptional regulator with XRE-family HTH domain